MEYVKTIRNKLKDFNELVMFQHTIFSASFILIAMIISSNEYNQSVWMGMKPLLLCIIALISARNFAMAFNRYCDINIDIHNQRTKNRPSVDGRISKREILIFCSVNAFIFIITSYCINNLAFYLSIPFLIILGGYSFIKRISSGAHFILGICLGLAPISGSIAIQGEIPLWSIMLAIGVMFWVAGFDILYSLQDIKVDRNQKLFSIPSKFGIKNALFISRFVHILAVISWCIFGYLCRLHLFGWVGILLSALILTYEQYLVKRDFANIPKAFFTTNGYLGFVLFIFILIDKIVLI